MEYLVIIVDKDYNSREFWFDNKYEAITFYRDSKKCFSNVSLYSCKEVIL